MKPAQERGGGRVLWSEGWDLPAGPLGAEREVVWRYVVSKAGSKLNMLPGQA